MLANSHSWSSSRLYRSRIHVTRRTYANPRVSALLLLVAFGSFRSNGPLTKAILVKVASRMISDAVSTSSKYSASPYSKVYFLGRRLRGTVTFDRKSSYPSSQSPVLCIVPVRPACSGPLTSASAPRSTFGSEHDDDVGGGDRSRNGKLDQSDSRPLPYGQT